MSREKSKQVFELINKSWITHLDLLYVGDDCGGDGPSIIVKYTDGTIDFWDYGGGTFLRYVYREGIVEKMIVIKNQELSDLIEEIICDNK